MIAISVVEAFALRSDWGLPLRNFTLEGSRIAIRRSALAAPSLPRPGLPHVIVKGLSCKVEALGGTPTYGEGCAHPWPTVWFISAPRGTREAEGVDGSVMFVVRVCN